MLDFPEGGGWVGGDVGLGHVHEAFEAVGV